MGASDKCQSCGMPLKSDPKGGARDADGSINPDYCSYCYADGQFVDPAMIETVRGKGLPRFVGKVFAARLEGLKRWRNG